MIVVVPSSSQPMAAVISDLPPQNSSRLGVERSLEIVFKFKSPKA